MASKSLSVTVRQTINADQRVAFEVIAPIDLRKVFPGYAFFPAVVDVRNYPGHWDKAGLSRMPVFTDGSTAHETLIDYDSPRTFSYEVTGFTNIFGHIVSKARGEWLFSTIHTGVTHIDWTYEFYPRKAMRPFLKCITPFWRRYMQKSLRLACQQVTGYRKP